MQVGVEDIKVNARLRVALRPLLRRVPIVGAVQVGGSRHALLGWAGLGWAAMSLIPNHPSCKPQTACAVLA